MPKKRQRDPARSKKPGKHGGKRRGAPRKLTDDQWFCAGQLCELFWRKANDRRQREAEKKDALLSAVRPLQQKAPLHLPHEEVLKWFVETLPGADYIIEMRADVETAFGLPEETLADVPASGLLARHRITWHRPHGERGHIKEATRRYIRRYWKVDVSTDSLDTRWKNYRRFERRLAEDPN